MLRSCKYCGKIHDTKLICPNKPQYFPKKSSTSTDIHRSYKWTLLSTHIRERDNYLCQCCLNGIMSDKKLSTNDLEVHHIDSITDNSARAYDVKNLVTLCRYHHEKAESGEISKNILFELVERKYGE